MDLNQKINVNVPPAFNPFTFKGRTKVLGMWAWSIIALILFGIIAGIGASSGGKMLWFNIFQIIPLVILWTVAVRRLHDHDLSGNWLFFLSPIGIGLMYMAYVLDLDSSINPVVQKINKTGIFNWLYAGTAWFFTSGIVLFCLLFLCVGKKKDNMFGPNPYPTAE